MENQQDESNNHDGSEKSLNLSVENENSHKRTTSISSVSSSGSLESTEKLIASLSKTNLNEIAKENDARDEGDAQNKTETKDEKVATEQSPPLVSESGVPDKETVGDKKKSGDGGLNVTKQRKAIKFTVRKVSCDSIESPQTSPNPDSAPSRNSSSTFQSRVPKDVEKLRLAKHKYESYSKRIVKIEKEIQFLTNLLPPYNVEIDYATRVKILNAIDKLKMKQDEVEKKKYDTGIIVSRLWRVQDESDLWVRNFGQ